ncbi:MAG: tetratricopeptide repeat protein [Candidatus Hodarchaeales archaeon]|jgi:tetratricopeptide (TPR) repeat protein
MISKRPKKVENPIKLVRSGTFAIKKKKWAKAKRKFEIALLDDEIQQNASVWANYGVSLTNLKLYVEARDAFTRAAHLENNSEIWVKKGLIESELKEYKEAEKSFQKAMKIDKKDPELPILLSRILRKQGKNKQAIKLLESSLKKHPKSHQIPIELAIVWNEEKNANKVEKVLKQAIHKAKNPDPGLLLAQNFLDKKQYDQAKAIYELVLINFPNSRHAQYGLGVTFHAKSELNKALDAYHKTLIMFRPEKPPQSLFINMGRAYKSLKQHKKAIDCLYRAKKHGKASLEIVLLLSELFLEINRPDRAKRSLEDAINIEKHNPIIRFYLGLTLLQLNDPVKAKENFSKALILDPDFHESKMQLAQLAMKEKNYKEAFKLANEVCSANPGHLSACKLAAKLAFDFQEYRKVIELIQPLVEEKPDSLEELQLLLQSWFLLSQPERAHSFMQILLENHKDLREKLTKIAFFSQFL